MPFHFSRQWSVLVVVALLVPVLCTVEIATYAFDRSQLFILLSCGMKQIADVNRFDLEASLMDFCVLF